MSAGLTLSTETLTGWMHRVLQRFGMFAVDAELVIARLLEAESRGHSRSGLAMLADIVTAFDLGDIDPRARTLTKLDLPAYALLDGSTGVGQVGASRAMLLAIEKARQTGLALVVVQNSQPCGDPVTYAELAAAADCVAFCTTNSGKARWPDEAESKLFASHPQAWGLPAGHAAVWVTQQAIDPHDLGGITGSMQPPAIVQGIVSLALTAGLSGARLPAAKKKASPFGAGAEHACLAIHLPTLQAAATWNDWIETTLPHSTAAWTRVTRAPLSDQFTLSAETVERLQEAAAASRVAWPE